MPGLTAAALLLAAALTPGDHARSVAVGSRLRSYTLHVPRGLAGAAPLVVAFHGGGGNGRVMQRYGGLDAVADRERFLVAYPDGSGRLPGVLTWNAGRCCTYAQREKVDDVAFARALIDDVAAAVSVDRQRVYATGMSNGAMMAYRLAAEMGDRLAAIAPVAGSRESELPAGAAAVPILHFHGTEDTHVPIGGGEGPDALAGVAFRSLDETLAPWLKTNGCGTPAEVVLLPDAAPADGTRVERRTFPRCTADVVVYVVRGGGHTWPGTTGRAHSLGRVTADISASELMWSFFAAHPRARTGAQLTH